MRKALWILSALPIIITAIVLQFMPDKIPAHYGISGEIDRWGSKFEYIIFPGNECDSFSGSYFSSHFIVHGSMLVGIISSPE